MLNDCEIRIKRRQLRDVSQVLSGLSRLVVDAVYRDVSLILEKTDYRLDDRALACTVGSQKDRQRARFEREGYVIACKVFAVTLGSQLIG